VHCCTDEEYETGIEIGVGIGLGVGICSLELEGEVDERLILRV
jgi:hypothetical protein